MTAAVEELRAIRAALAAQSDELRIIRVTLAAQSLGCEPTSISQEWLDSAYAAAYAKAKGTIQ